MAVLEEIRGESESEIPIVRVICRRIIAEALHKTGDDSWRAVVREAQAIAERDALEDQISKMAAVERRLGEKAA